MEHRFNFFWVCILYCFFSTEKVMGVYVHSSGFLFAVQLNIIRNRKPISVTYTRTKTSHKHRGICCLLSLVKTCLIHYSIIFNLTTVNVPRIENIIFFNLQKKTFPFRCVWYLVVPQTGNQSCVHIHPLLFQY
jgi:hypothetical protein